MLCEGCRILQASTPPINISVLHRRYLKEPTADFLASEERSKAFAKKNKAFKKSLTR